MALPLVLPQVGLISYFTFKEPVSTYIRNTFNLNTSSKKMEVLSILSLVDMTQLDLKNPYLELYLPAGISEETYSEDLANNVKVLTLRVLDTNQLFRVPFSFITDIRDPSTIEYINKLIVIDLGVIPESLKSTTIFNELSDIVERYLGIRPSLKEVAIGLPTFLSQDEHKLREVVRTNSIEVYTPLSMQLMQSQELLSDVLNRLNVLGITLSS